MLLDGPQMRALQVQRQHPLCLALYRNHFQAPITQLCSSADGNGDGKIDIWNTQEDAFASAANYLATEGWESGLPWGASQSRC